METKAPKRNKSSETKLKKLTKKEREFVEEYLVTGNGTQSALKVYDTDNENTAASIASENLRKPKIVLLLEEVLNDSLLAKKHEALLNSTKIEHMTFPLGPKGEDDINLSGAQPDTDPDKKDEFKVERTTLTDEEIKEMYAEVNCKVKRIVHGETARHVYFWAQDNKAVKDALDMAYKIKGKYAPEKHVNLNIEIEANDRVKDLAKKLNS